MTNRYLLLALFLLLLAPLSAAAQQSAEARIESAKRRATAAGIPTTLLDSRIAEGRAKGVPMDRIAAVVERRAASLAAARQAMSGARALSEADLAAGADAVEAGIGGQALREVIAGARAEDRPVAIAVLTYLHREQGMGVEQALAQVRAASARGPEALRNLPAQARAGGMGRGGPPAGVGNRPDVGRGRPGGGPPAALPAPGQQPGAGKPDNPGQGKPQTPPGKGKPGGGAGGA